MRKIMVIVGALLVALLAHGQQKWTLQQCVDTALANNRNVKQKELTRQTNEIAYRQARLNLLPDLNASASQSWTFGRSQMANGTYQNVNSSSSSIGLSSGITLFDGLRMKYNIDAKAVGLKASEADLEKQQKDIALSVSSGFLQVLLNKELLQVAQEQLQLTDAKIKQQKSLVDAGKLAEGEIYELYAQQSKEELSRTQAENSLKLSLLDLAQIMELADFENLDVEVPADLTPTELQLLNPEQVYKSALENRPEVKSAEYNLKSSETNVKIARSYYFPSLSLGASVGTGYYNSVSIPLSTSVGFSLTVPIFNKMEVSNQVKTAQLNVESSKLNLDNAKIELRKSIQQAYLNAVAAQSKWNSAIKSEQSSSEAYRFANQKYEAGRSTVYELYQAKSNLSQAESAVIQAKYEYVFSLKVLELLQ